MLLEKNVRPLNVIYNEREAKENGSWRIPNKKNNDILLDSTPFIPSVSCQSNFPTYLCVSKLEGIIISILQRVDWGIKQQQHLPLGRHSSGKVSRTHDSEIGGTVNAYWTKTSLPKKVSWQGWCDLKNYSLPEVQEGEFSGFTKETRTLSVLGE